MTIRPGQEWGEVVAAAGPVVEASSDPELARLLSGPATAAAVVVTGGDVLATVGGRSPDGAFRRRYPVDLLSVVLDGGDPRPAVAHVVARRSGPWGWIRGELWAAMNVSAIGRLEVAPRAHPNDGRVDVVAVDAGMPWRERLMAARRLRTGTHVPHPAISTRPHSTVEWVAARPVRVTIDGIEAGLASAIAVTVHPDAATFEA